MRLTEAQARAIFTCAGIAVHNVFELENGYLPKADSYAVYRMNNPWFLFDTEFGFIIIGARKSVMSISWAHSPMRVTVTDDDVTKSEEGVHAWNLEKAVSYMSALASYARTQ